MFGLAYSFVRNREAAEDVGQEVFIRVWRAPPWVGVQPQVSPLALPLGVAALGIMLALVAPPLLLQCHRRMSRRL